MNVKEEKNLTDDMAPTKALNYSCWLHLPVELKSLQMFRESECSHDNSKTGLRLQKSLRKRKAWVETIFSFSIFFLPSWHFVTHHEFLGTLSL